jgi:hypothetical protein
VDGNQFDAKRALEALTDEGVRFVLIGGLAANMHGSHQVTLDLDICYARDPVNLERLANALRGIHAHLRGAPPEVAFLLDSRTLEAGDSFTFSTDAGPLDCLGTPAGTTGFESLDANAVEARIHGMKIRVAALEDLIRMKRAAGRPKDRMMLEELGALREEIESRERPS